MRSSSLDRSRLASHGDRFSGIGTVFGKGANSVRFSEQRRGVHVGRTAIAFTHPVCRCCCQTPPRSPGSRAESFPTCPKDRNSVYRPRSAGRGLVLTPPPVLPSRFRLQRVGAPEEFFHGSIPSPSVPLSNASPAMSPPPAHDSRSGWFAAPFPWGSCIPDSLPVCPALSGCPRSPRSHLDLSLGPDLPLPFEAS